MLTGLFGFIVPVQDLVMQGGTAVWRGSHSSTQFFSFLYTNYVYLILACPASFIVFFSLFYSILSSFYYILRIEQALPF